MEAMKLSNVQQKFVLHWGEMGTRWGINRTVAQVHALLYIWPQPLNAEQITETLGVARSNVSTSLRELQSWGIVAVVHVMGDRRDYFETYEDVWEMFQLILDERKKREIDPTRKLLSECIEEAEAARRPDVETIARLKAMQSFFDTMTGWYTKMRKMPQGVMLKFVRMGDKVQKLIGRS